MFGAKNTEGLIRQFHHGTLVVHITPLAVRVGGRVAIEQRCSGEDIDETGVETVILHLLEIASGEFQPLGGTEQPALPARPETASAVFAITADCK